VTGKAGEVWILGDESDPSLDGSEWWYVLIELCEGYQNKHMWWAMQLNDISADRPAGTLGRLTVGYKHCRRFV